MKPLTVYKASAGSGKTFTLAVEYIKLLINDPQCFKHILAVTFTNKATEEMKLRILSQLYGIWKMLPESDVYMKNVCGSLGINEKQASRQAGMALSCMVHGYHYFRVETIDSFFQSILRNLARELDLTANLKIGLNDKQVEEQAVDQLIESLNSTSIILQWLISYIFSNIDESKSWNVIGQIKEFGQTIFKDFYKTVSSDLNATVSQQDFFNDYVKRLKSIKSDAKRHMRDYADEFERETANAGLTPLSYNKKKSGISSYFNKLKSDKFSDAKCKNTVLDACLRDAENWSAKSSRDRDIIISLVNNKLMALLVKAEEDRPKQWELYATADCTLRHLDKLRLLNSIESKVRELNGDANRFLLSDTQHLLHTLIRDNDTPFIFEKAGCQLEHIMIDEFQDTSTVQWQNFKVLLKECMSRSNAGSDVVNNLIVGDVKQSIYRWRAGDWRLLNNIEKQFSLPEQNIGIMTLQTNYRSERNIINFNNSFFKIASRIEYEDERNINNENVAAELLTAYADVSQTILKDKREQGLVRIKLLPDEQYDEAMLDNVNTTIRQLIAAGASQNDIAILPRYNQYIPIIADYLMENNPGLKIVSDEAFRLDASLAVNTIIQALRLLLNPEDVLAKTNLVIAYQKKILEADLGISEMLVNAKRSIEELLPQDFIENVGTLASRPLIDIIEHIYKAFHLERLESQSAYICAFYDQVSEFTSNNSGNIKKFLEAWNDDICRKTIQSDETDGIRIISIHKSKGLEYDNVIIPYCDWALESRHATLWCKPGKEPFNSLPIVSLDYNKNLLETIYSDDYKNEHIQNRVDNLNLLYVAFTRASKNLFVFGRKKVAKDGLGCRSKLIVKCLPELNKALAGSKLAENHDDDDLPSTFEYGRLAVAAPRGKSQAVTNNVFLRPAIRQKINIETSQLAVEFKQSNKSRDFIANDDREDVRDRYIKTGNILHKIFSMIHTAADIDNALRQLEFEGILYDEDITIDKMKAMLSERLSDEKVADWFSPRWRVFNECSIISYDEKTRKVTERRPDRVITDGETTTVIDFKFGSQRQEYLDQMRQYMGLLDGMGMKNVSGYLWFVYTNKIIKVEKNNQ